MGPQGVGERGHGEHGNDRAGRAERQVPRRRSRRRDWIPRRTAYEQQRHRACNAGEHECRERADVNGLQREDSDEERRPARRYGPWPGEPRRHEDIGNDERDHRDDAEDDAGRRAGGEVRPLVDREHEQDRARDRRQAAEDAADPDAVPAGDERDGDDEARREQELQRDNRQALLRTSR